MKNERLKETESMLSGADRKIELLEFGKVPAKKKQTAWYGVRHTQVLMLFMLMVVGYGMRINLSVGIVAMTDASINPDIQTYDWSIGTKSNILSSFFWGYILPQIFAGRLAEMYGPKWFLAGAMATSSVFGALIPAMARAGSWGVLLCRVMQGASQGFFLPSIQFLLGKWAPLNERSRLASLAYAGGPLGTVICMPVTGWLAASSVGWPSAFYLYGALGFVWTFAWIWLGSNAPSQHTSISEEEQTYIEKYTAGDSGIKKKYPIPFKHMIKSMPLWGILIAFCGQNWGYWTLMTEIPTYMNGVLDFDIQSNGLLSAAPYFALFIASFFLSAMSDFLINRKLLSLNNTRKLLSIIGLVGPAIALFTLGMIGNPGRGTAVTLLIIAVSVNAAVFCGHQINSIDIAPTHAATLMGVTNGFGNIVSIIAPLIVQYIVTDESDSDQWKIVFFIASGMYFVCDVFYTVVGKADVQYWDTLEEGDDWRSIKAKTLEERKKANS